MLINLLPNTEDVVSASVDGNYTYVGFASDDSGSDYASSYSEGTHLYQAILTSETEIENPNASNFAGLWVPIGALEAEQTVYTYVGYADDDEGTNFTTTYNINKEYYAILVSSTAKTPVVGDFDGLWRQATPQFKAFNEYVPSFFDTNELAIHTTAAASMVHYGPCCYYYEGTYKRFYFAFLEGGLSASNTVTSSRRTVANGYNAEHYNRSWISYYDVETGSFGEPQVFAEIHGAYPAASEEAGPHNIPVVIVTDNGRILVFKDDLDFTGAAGLHNAHIEVWRSNATEDISAFTKVEALGDWTPEYAFAYPNAFKLSDGTIVLTCRSKEGSEERHQVAMKSEDNGVTWTDMEGVSDTRTIIASFDGNGAGWYLYNTFAGEHSGINLVLNSVDSGETGNPAKDIYFLHSDDGVTWENARQFVEGSGGYSVDITAAGAIDNADLDTYFRVDYLADGDSISIMSLSASMDKNGIPYILANKCDRDGDSSFNNNTNLYVYYYDVATHAWITVDVLPNIIMSGNPEFDVAPRFRAHIIAYENGIFDIFTGVTDKEESEIDLLYTGGESLWQGYNLITSGTLIAGLIYKVVTLTDSAFFGSGILAGDTFRATGSETPTDGNTVIEVKCKPYRFRTSDYGASFQPFKMFNGDYKHGGGGAFGYNMNNQLDKKLFLYYPVYESVNGVEVEYQNFLCWYSDLNR